MDKRHTENVSHIPNVPAITHIEGIPSGPVVTHWALDKRIPVALIATIIIGGLVHTLTFAWAASNLWTRVGELERQQILNSPRLEAVTKLEVKVDMITQQITEMRQSQSAQMLELKQAITGNVRR
jgi:hypothetical protein